MKVILAIFLLPCIVLTDDTQKIGKERLSQLKRPKPAFQDVGIFIEGGEKIVLSVKVVNSCKDEPLCTPLSYRIREQGQLVQYEVYNCYCGKAERAAAAKEKKKERRAHEQKKRLELRDELETWAKVSRKRLREVALSNEEQRMQIEATRRLRYGSGRTYRRYHSHDNYIGR